MLLANVLAYISSYRGSDWEYQLRRLADNPAAGAGLTVLGFISLTLVIRALIPARARLAAPASTLVLTRFDISRQPANRPYIDIAGRKAGFLAWLYALCGGKNQTTLSVSASLLVAQRGGFGWNTTDAAPLHNIASTHCGYTRSSLWLLFAVVFTAGGIGATVMSRSADAIPLIGGLVLAAVCVLAYVLSKRLSLTVMTTGGLTIVFRFRSGLAGSVRVDLPKVRECVHVINALVGRSGRADRPHDVAVAEPA